MALRSPLDDPATAAHAWRHYWWLMRRMGLITAATVCIALLLVYWQIGMVSVNLYIALGLGIGFTMLLMSALMGLMFLSHGTGHDEAIEDPLRDESGYF